MVKNCGFPLENIRSRLELLFCRHSETHILMSPLIAPNLPNFFPFPPTSWEKCFTFFHRIGAVGKQPKDCTLSQSRSCCIGFVLNELRINLELGGIWQSVYSHNLHLLRTVLFSIQLLKMPNFLFLHLFFTLMYRNTANVI